MYHSFALINENHVQSLASPRQQWTRITWTHRSLTFMANLSPQVLSKMVLISFQRILSIIFSQKVTCNFLCLKILCLPVPLRLHNRNMKKFQPLSFGRKISQNMTEIWKNTHDFGRSIETKQSVYLIKSGPVTLFQDILLHNKKESKFKLM